MKQIVFVLALIGLSIPAFAQTTEKNTLWMEYLEELSESEIESSLIENMYEELSFLSEHPFDLNTVTKMDLERLPFLSEIQIENILYYTYKYTPLTNIYELKNMEGLDFQTIQYLIPFVYVGEVKTKESINIKRAVKYGKNEVLFRIDDCLQQKSGYRKGTEEERELHPSHFYLGEKQYLSARYGFQYKDNIQLGVVGEKDAGEAFWNDNHKGFDFYSAHFVLKNKGILEGLYLGDYRLSFGQGLVLNTDFVTGKTSDVVNISKKSSGIKRHFSANESDFFRGAAVALKLKKTHLNFFLSHRELDASADSTSISTFKTDGYNRTANDLLKRRQATVNLGGANIQWKNESFNIGFTGITYNFGGKKLAPEIKPYTIYNLRGNDNYNIGVNYSYQNKKYVFQGETAMGKNRGIATINNLLITPASYLNFSLSYRHYDYHYQGLYSRSLGEGSTVQNENGFYLGIRLFLLKRWEIATYTDVFHFPWLKYGIDAPSSGKDMMLQLTYKANQNVDMSLRYKFKEKEKNVTEKITFLLPYSQHRWKYQFKYQPAKNFSSKTQLDFNLYENTNKQQTSGWSIAQSIGYKGYKKWQWDISVAYFDAVEWNNRISSYEKNVLYAFSVPAFYGNGMRYSAVFKWDIFNFLTLYAKVGSTHYFDKSVISSGLEEITGKVKTDTNCLLKFKF